MFYFSPKIDTKLCTSGNFFRWHRLKLILATLHTVIKVCELFFILWLITWLSNEIGYCQILFLGHYTYLRLFLVFRRACFFRNVFLFFRPPLT